MEGRSSGKRAVCLPSAFWAATALAQDPPLPFPAERDPNLSLRSPSPRCGVAAAGSKARRERHVAASAEQ
eukprot:2495710-Pleurochrysis_carterae.AAC.1